MADFARPNPTWFRSQIKNKCLLSVFRDNTYLTGYHKQKGVQFINLHAFHIVIQEVLTKANRLSDKLTMQLYVWCKV